MGWLDWIKQRQKGGELSALAQKYGHDSIGSPGAAIRHYEKIIKARNETVRDPGGDNQKTKLRPRPSWER